MIVVWRRGLHALGRTSPLNPEIQPSQVISHHPHPLWDPGLGAWQGGKQVLSPPAPPGPG